METDLSEIFEILDAIRDRHAKALIDSPLEEVREIQIKIKHISAIKTHLSTEIKTRRSPNARNSR